MLARSGKGPELLGNLQESVLNKRNKFNRLVASLEPKDSMNSSTARPGVTCRIWNCLNTKSSQEIG